KGVDADVPEAAAAPFRDEPHVVALLQPEVEHPAQDADLAKMTLPKPVADGLCLRMVAIHEGFGEHGSRALGGGDHRVDLAQGDGKRLFTKHVQATLHRAD